MNGVPLAAFDDVSEIIKSDLFKDQGPCTMEVMFQLIHSNNHETSSVVKDMLPVVVNKAGTSPPFPICYLNFSTILNAICHLKQCSIKQRIQQKRWKPFSGPCCQQRFRKDNGTIQNIVPINVWNVCLQN